MDSMGPDNRAATDRELAITRVYDAPRDAVFKAWTRPERLEHWWGPRGFTVPYLKMQVHAGGRWRSCLRSVLDEAELWLGGVYHEVVEHERVVFTKAGDDALGRALAETVVTVTFADEDGRTRLTVRQRTFETKAARDEHREGWASCLDRLAEYLLRARPARPRAGQAYPAFA